MGVGEDEDSADDCGVGDDDVIKTRTVDDFTDLIRYYPLCRGERCGV